MPIRQAQSDLYETTTAAPKSTATKVFSIKVFHLFLTQKFFKEKTVRIAPHYVLYFYLRKY